MAVAAGGWFKNLIYVLACILLAYWIFPFAPAPITAPPSQLRAGEP